MSNSCPRAPTVCPDLEFELTNINNMSWYLKKTCFFHVQSSCSVLDAVPAEEVSRCQGECFEEDAAAGKEVFSDCVKTLKNFLSNEPYKEFENSMYFHRYLQWKWLER